MDYMHGSSFIFGNIRSTIDKEEEKNNCYFCNGNNDNPEHQLLDCTEVADITHQNFRNRIENMQQYVEEILVPKNKNIQESFIDRIKFLKGQHEFLEEENSDN